MSRCFVEKSRHYSRSNRWLPVAHRIPIPQRRLHKCRCPMRRPQSMNMRIGGKGIVDDQAACCPSMSFPQDICSQKTQHLRPLQPSLPAQVNTFRFFRYAQKKLEIFSTLVTSPQTRLPRIPVSWQAQWFPANVDTTQRPRHRDQESHLRDTVQRSL